MKTLSKILLIISLLISCEIYSQQQWLSLGKATNQNLWKCSFVDTLNGWAVGDSGTIVHTSNGGLNWVTQNSKIKEYMISVFFLNKRLGWALAWGLSMEYFGTYILKTTNGGATWDTARYHTPDTYIRTVFFIDSLTGYMGGGPAILIKTTNGGINWFNSYVDTSVIVSRFPISKFRFLNKNFGIACGGVMDIAGVVWKTTNGGSYWSASAIAPEPITDIKIYDTSNYLAVGGDYEFGASILRTSNAGLNWTYKTMGVYGIPSTLSFRTNTEGWCPLGYLTFFIMTTDNGFSWIQRDTPDSTQIFDIVFLNNKFGIGVGLNGSVIKFDYSSVNINNYNSVPYITNLFQNYPNPFNPYTNIEYYVSGISEIELKIFNVTGKEVSTLFKGFKSEGKYSHKFFGYNLPSGIYFYSLKTKNLKTGITNIESKKMILIK